MKIQSKFKDFYDYAVDFSSNQFFYNRVGALVLNRNQECSALDGELRAMLGLEAKITSSKSESLIKLYDFIKRKSLLNIYSSAALAKLVVIVGKICIEKYVIIDKKDGKIKEIESFEASSEDKDLICTLASVKAKSKKQGYVVKSELSQETYELLLDVGVPIAGFFCKSKDGLGLNKLETLLSGVCLNQKLSYFELGEHLGANEIVQELEMFFGKKREALENLKTEIPDSVKIQQHGFDKKSFRKEKSKNK